MIATAQLPAGGLAASPKAMDLEARAVTVGVAAYQARSCTGPSVELEVTSGVCFDFNDGTEAWRPDATESCTINVYPCASCDCSPDFSFPVTPQCWARDGPAVPGVSSLQMTC